LPYRIEYSPAAVEHLKGLATSQQRTVLDSVDEQLRYQPALETRNRKPMRPNPVAPWELRIGILRVYYELEAAETVVRILAVGVKERDVVRIGGEVIKL
jgi:mRNA-degrading endonuclease RelE of RelBE toxin-antitoxin system